MLAEEMIIVRIVFFKQPLKKKGIIKNQIKYVIFTN